MEFFLYGLIALIMATVLYLAFQAIGRGLDARNDLKRDGTLDKNREDPYTFKSIDDDEDEKILKKLKNKDLSSQDLKKMYEEMQKKNKLRN